MLNSLTDASDAGAAAATRPKVLFVAGPSEDYLADGLFRGLRALLGPDVVDYPRMDAMYDTITPTRRQQLYGRGFSLYGELPDLDIDRLRVDSRLAEGRFDIVVFSDIHRTFGLFMELLPLLDRAKVAVLDGSDSPVMFPYCGTYWRRRERWFLPRAHRRFLYFKREWTIETLRSRYYRLVPRALLARIPPPPNLRTIGFSFPDEKIIDDQVQHSRKTTRFPRHIVDPEVRAQIQGATSAYAFDSEADYYNDLRLARFGVTTKRGGWDCLRHYEIAANGAVPCFRDLDQKPTTCAPHGLNADNCVSYTSAADLLKRIEPMTDTEYNAKRLGALKWVRANSTRTRARQVLSVLGFPLKT